MKLHQLVKLRNLLDESIRLHEVKEATDILLQRIDSISVNLPEEYTGEFKHVRDYYAEINKLLDTKPPVLTALRDKISNQIIQLTRGFDRRGYMINGMEAASTSNVEMIRNDRIIPLSIETMEIIKNRIGVYSDWKYPGLEVGCRDGKWTNLLVANDPLYAVDFHPEFIEETTSQFTPEFQSRLRPYLLNWNGVTLNHLPKNQIGFAFAWNIFNYLPQVEMTEYLTDIFSLLRPGGVLLFSYNDCDVPTQARFAEEGWMSWMPKTLLLPILSTIGYEVLQEFNPTSTVSWVEVKKPGVLTTIKAHQVLGEIKSRNT